MFPNYIKTSFRNLSKYKLNTIIHVLGLSLGIGCCILIYLFIRYENSFDTHHQNAKNIYRITMDTERESGMEYEGNTPYPLAPALRAELPESVTVGRIHVAEGSTIEIDTREKFSTDFLFAEPEISRILSFEVLEGDLLKTLEEPNQVAVTKSFAQRLFGAENSLGKSIIIDNLLQLEITALIEDLPANGHLRGDMLVSFESFNRDFLGFDTESWGVTIGGITYLLIPESISRDRLENLLSTFVDRKIEKTDGKGMAFGLQPLNEMHFDMKYGAFGTAQALDKKYLWFFTGIGLLILLMACINFINLSTAQSNKRAKEIGVRKVIGAQRIQLVLQFMGETFVLALLAACLAIIIIQMSLPSFNGLLQKEIHINWMTDYDIIGMILLTVAGLVFLAGLYPAIMISNFNPLNTLKTGTTTNKNGGGLLMRKSLVTVQFAISLLMVTGTLAISKQLRFFRNHELGFKQEHIIELNMPERDHFELLRTEWETHSGISGCSFALGAPTSANSIHTSIYPDPQNPDAPFSIIFKAVDGEYRELFDLELAAGRWFSATEEKMATLDIPRAERKYSMLVNESLVQSLGYVDPKEIVGRIIKLGINNIEAVVIGVTRDFHMTSLHEPIDPMIMLNFPQWYYTANIRIQPHNIGSAIDHIEKVWSETFPEYLFEYEFVDESLAALYESEERTYTLFEIFAGIALLIACLGLWGLVTFIAEQRTREIGIRKILGASGIQVVHLISRPFMKMLGIAFLLATPISWIGISQWLQNFSYRIDLAPQLFLIGGILIFILTWCTLGYHALKVAFVDPVKSLRHE